MAKLFLSMTGKLGRLTRSGLLGEFLQAASIVLGQPLLNGPTGIAGNLHDLRAGQTCFGQIDSLDASSQAGLGLPTVQSLQLLQTVMRFYGHSGNLHAFVFNQSTMTCIG
jgi:hypothetical protein